jgi:hypothetical protein
VRERDHLKDLDLDGRIIIIKNGSSKQWDG